MFICNQICSPSPPAMGHLSRTQVLEERVCRLIKVNAGTIRVCLCIISINMLCSLQIKILDVNIIKILYRKSF